MQRFFHDGAFAKKAQRQAAATDNQQPITGLDAHLRRQVDAFVLLDGAARENPAAG
jgi:hypothetical protein